MVKYDEEKSAFNFAYEYLKSMKASLDVCKLMAYQNNVNGWLKALRTVYRELTLMTNDDEDKVFKTKFEEIYKINNDPYKRKTHRDKILSLLDDLEILIRKTMQKKGMVLPNKADPRFAILER